MSNIIRDNAKKIVWMTAASILMAFGNYFFKFANNFTFGGITGLAVVVAKTGLVTAGDFSFVANNVLLVIGIIVLGRKFIAKRLIAVSFIPLCFLRWSEWCQCHSRLRMNRCWN